jgi:hypothetical protein
MEAHVDKLQVTIKDRLSACHVIFVLDNSSNHTKCSDDAVLSRRMTVNPGTEALASVRCQQCLHSAIDAFVVMLSYRRHEQLQGICDDVPSSLQDGLL